MATTGPEADDPNTVAMKAMRDFIEFASKGEMKMELIFGGALGGDRELMELVQANQLQVVMVSLGPVAGFFPEIQVFSLPYSVRFFDLRDQLPQQQRLCRRPDRAPRGGDRVQGAGLCGRGGS